MKILEPFSGYKLASAHPLFHLALFVASFSVNPHTNNEDPQTKSEVEGHFLRAFIWLRWSHLAVALLAFPVFFGSMKTLNHLRLYRSALTPE